MKKTTTGRLGRTLLLAALAALSVPTAGENAAAQAKETILRIHGSNTIGTKLAPDLAAQFLKKLGAESVSRTEIAQGTEIDVEGHFQGKNEIKVVEIRAHGSTTAFKSLKDGQCDVGMASRKIKDAEAKELAFLGDMSSTAAEHVLALDGVAVIVNAANAKAGKMDFAILSDIFSGKIKNWSELGGTDAQIVIHARDEQSGTHDTFQSLVMGKQTLAASAHRYDSNEALSAAVNADVHGIGYCGLPYVGHNKALAISNGGPAIRPTIFTVSAEDYPVSRRLHLYTPAVPSNPYVQDFVDFALGKEGQEQAKRHRFVELTIAAEEFKLEVSGTSHNYQVIYKYLEAVRDAKRLSTNFRFKGKTLELDNRGVRDLERMVDFLSENKSAEIILAGFSDRKDEGSSVQSLKTSCKRAEMVKEELLSRGIKVLDALCVGEELPVASNETEQGREKNRRVEAWVR